MRREKATKVLTKTAERQRGRGAERGGGGGAREKEKERERERERERGGRELSNNLQKYTNRQRQTELQMDWQGRRISR